MELKSIYATHDFNKLKRSVWRRRSCTRGDGAELLEWRIEDNETVGNVYRLLQFVQKSKMQFKIRMYPEKTQSVKKR